MNFKEMNQRLINQLETYGVAFDKAAEVYEVADRTSGAAIGESYHAYLTSVLTDYNESKKAEINQLAESFYKSSLESMKGKQAPISQLLEEPSESHETYEQYRGANLTELSVSLATAIKNEAPSIYATLI